MRVGFSITNNATKFFGIHRIFSYICNHSGISKVLGFYLFFRDNHSRKKNIETRPCLLCLHIVCNVIRHSSKKSTFKISSKKNAFLKIIFVKFPLTNDQIYYTFILNMHICIYAYLHDTYISVFH